MSAKLKSYKLVGLLLDGSVRATTVHAEFLGADCVFADRLSPETGIMSVVRACAWREQAFCFLPRSLLL